MKFELKYENKNFVTSLIKNYDRSFVYHRFIIKFVSYYLSLDLSGASTKFWNKVGRNEEQLWYICRIEQDSWTASCLSIISSRNYTRNRYRLWINNG